MKNITVHRDNLNSLRNNPPPFINNLFSDRSNRFGNSDQISVRPFSSSLRLLVISFSSVSFVCLFFWLCFRAESRVCLTLISACSGTPGPFGVGLLFVLRMGGWRQKGDYHHQEAYRTRSLNRKPPLGTYFLWFMTFFFFPFFNHFMSNSSLFFLR